MNAVGTAIRSDGFGPPSTYAVNDVPIAPENQ